MLFYKPFETVAKMFLAMTALSLSVFAVAEDCGYPQTACAPSCGTESCCGTPCNAAPDCSWAYNPPAYARCGCENTCQNGFLDSFTFRADFLWWRACEGDLELGTEEDVNTFSDSTQLRSRVGNSSRSKRPDFKYDPGFRIGLSNNCACDCWDVAVNWTHFHTKAKARGEADVAPPVPALNSSLPKAVAFISDWERVVGINPSTSRGRYSLNLDLVDLEFGRKFYTSKCFVLRPQFGLRFARIYQNYRIASIQEFNPEGVLVSYASLVKSRSNFLAVGPRVGLDIELDLGCGLAIVGQAASSIVFGKFDNHSRERLINRTAFGDGLGIYDYNTRDSVNRDSRAITDLAFGFKWDRCFEWCNQSHPVSLAFVWEHHVFHDLNNFNFAERGVVLNQDSEVTFTGANPRKRGDLYTQGLTVSLSFGF